MDNFYVGTNVVLININIVLSNLNINNNFNKQKHHVIKLNSLGKFNE